MVGFVETTDQRLPDLLESAGEIGVQRMGAPV
jgi:hypothetical protein